MRIAANNSALKSDGRSRLPELQAKVAVGATAIISALSWRGCSLRETGTVLDKPKGRGQPSMYDADRERILHALWVPLTTLVDIYLMYGEYLSLENYLSNYSGRQAETLTCNHPNQSFFLFFLTTHYLPGEFIRKNCFYAADTKLSKTF